MCRNTQKYSQTWSDWDPANTGGSEPTSSFTEDEERRALVQQFDTLTCRVLVLSDKRSFNGGNTVSVVVVPAESISISKYLYSHSCGVLVGGGSVKVVVTEWSSLSPYLKCPDFMREPITSREGGWHHSDITACGQWGYVIRFFTNRPRVWDWFYRADMVTQFMDYDMVTSPEPRQSTVNIRNRSTRSRVWVFSVSVLHITLQHSSLVNVFIIHLNVNPQSVFDLIENCEMTWFTFY